MGCLLHSQGQQDSSTLQYRRSQLQFVHFPSIDPGRPHQYLKIHLSISGTVQRRIDVIEIPQPGSGISGLFSMIYFLISNFIRLFLLDIGCTPKSEYSKSRLKMNNFHWSGVLNTNGIQSKLLHLKGIPSDECLHLHKALIYYEMEGRKCSFQTGSNRDFGSIFRLSIFFIYYTYFYESDRRTKVAGYAPGSRARH